MTEEKKDRRFKDPQKKRTVRLEIMVSPAEQEEMIRAAESRGMSLSEHIRDCVAKWEPKKGK